MWLGRQDFLYTLRSTRRTPLLSIIAILALSLGIGLNAGVFTLLDVIFLSPPTQADPGSFVQIFPHYEGWFTGAEHSVSFTSDDYDAIRSRSTALESVAAWHGTDAILEQGRQRVETLLVSCNYFAVFRNSAPLLGRSLIADDCKRNTVAPVALLDEVTWRNQFDSNPKIVGQAIHLNGMAFTVIGVIKAGAGSVLTAGVYAPYTLQPLIDHRSANLLTAQNAAWLQIAGRMRASVSRVNTQAELTGIMREQDHGYPQHKDSKLDRKSSVRLTNGSFIESPGVQDSNIFATLMTLVMGPLFLVLLLACTNVTMLFLSRAVMRRGEIAVRVALGAGRSRLLRMLLLESLLVALIAGAVSIAVADYVPQMIMSRVDPRAACTMRHLHMDWRVFCFLAALVSIAAAVSALAPMRAAWKVDLISALKGREGSATMRSRLTSSLIVAQIAMSFVLLAAAVLFVRLPGKVTGMDTGFETHHMLIVPLETDFSDAKHDATVSLQQAIETRLAAIPGVEAIVHAELDPFRGSIPQEVRLPSQEKGQGMQVSLDHVSTNFFPAFAIQILRGGSFHASDQPAEVQAPARQPSDAHTPVTHASVAIVSKSFAQQYWPGADPLGKVVLTSDDLHYTVVGVAADTRSEQFGILDGPRVYLPQTPAAINSQIFVRFSGNTTLMETTVRDAVNTLDPASTVTPQTIWESLEADANNMRTLAHIIVIMASIAVLLAITGVYAVLSFATQRRTREFGIRMVLGAGRVSIFRSILARGCMQIAAGLFFGIMLATPAAWSFARLTQRSPFPFQSFDISVYGIAAAMLMAVSLAAMYLPALRATRVDPMISLRTE